LICDKVRHEQHESPMRVAMPRRNDGEDRLAGSRSIAVCRASNHHQGQRNTYVCFRPEAAIGV
jgi:hypothetical protein